MSKQNLVSKAVRFALVCGAAGFGANAALADDTTSATTTTTTTTTDNGQSTAQLGKIEVTGTKIKRTDVEQAQPVNIVTSAQIKATGLATVGQIIQKLTSSGASLSTLDNFGGNFTFTGGGESTVDLRNLGAQRVLVLVNGRRWVTGLDGTVDLNTIPVSVIDHIEVLQDGASAIYGSDAIAGVVNIITVKNYNGESADAYLGTYQGDGHTDGRTESYDFTMGSSNDKSGIQDGILSKDRNISKEPVVGQGAASGSSAIPNGRFVFIAPGTGSSTSPNNKVNTALTGLTAAQCPTTNFGSSKSPDYQPLCDLTLKGPVTGVPTASDFRPFVSGGANSDRFNYAPYNYVLTPEERYSTYFQGYEDLADNLTFKADMMYTHRNSSQQAAPEPLFFASSSIALNIPANQKYNPFHIALDADSLGPDLLLLGRRMVENGVRSYNEQEDTYRLSGGLNGYFNMLGGEWDWDANYAFSKDDETDINGGHFDVSKIRLALGDPAVCAAVSGCVPLNLFGGEGAITKKMLDYIAYTAQNDFQNNQRIYNVDISNNQLGNLPGGPMGLAIGLEDLEHDGIFLPSSVAEAGNDSFNPGRPVLPTEGRTDEKSIYAELDLPLVGGLPGMKLLDLDLADRESRYNSFGDNNTGRWGLKWEVNDDLLLRGTWSQGFRAPSIQDLYSAGTNFSANVTDPCDAPAKSSLCAKQGVPSNYLQPNAQINTLEIGNSNLKPETSISRTVGFVYSPSSFSGFNLSADYYNIVINNTIQPTSGQILLDECYGTGTFQGQAPDPTACAHITRTIFGAIQTLEDQVTNVGTTITAGIDVNASYAFPSTSVGDFKLTFDDTHIRSYRTVYPLPGGGANVVELAGGERGGSVFPFGVPKDKAHISLDWASGGWSAEYTLRYISAVWEPCLSGTQPAPIGDGTCSTPGPINPVGSNYNYAMNHDGAVVYHDVQGSYDMGSWTYTIGVRNLFSKEPPISSVQELNSFDPTLYDVPGRFLYGRISVKF
jgi:outer membrane receptor protein involved in Fe transport